MTNTAIIEDITADVEVYTAIVVTYDAKGKVTRETLRNLTADQLVTGREYARTSSPAGSTRTFRVVGQH